MGGWVGGEAQRWQEVKGEGLAVQWTTISAAHTAAEMRARNRVKRTQVGTPVEGGHRHLAAVDQVGGVDLVLVAEVVSGHRAAGLDVRLHAVLILPARHFQARRVGQGSK